MGGKSLEVKKQNAVSFAGDPDFDPTLFGDVDQSDILIPKLLLMQGLSKFVGDEKATMGDFVNSVTGQVLGGKSKGVRFVPLDSFKTWVLRKWDGKQYSYQATVPFTPANAVAPWDDEAIETTPREFIFKSEVTPEAWAEASKGKAIEKIRRDQVLNYYVMLESDLDNPAAFPMLIALSRSSYKAGKKLANHFMQAKMLRMFPCFKVFEITSSKQTNDDGQPYYASDIAEVRPMNLGEGADQDAYQLGKTWVKTLKAMKVRVDDSDLQSEARATVEFTDESEF